MGGSVAGMKFDEIENLRIYQQAEEIADRIWTIVAPWGSFSKETVGRQLVRSADSIGANIAEGYGRFHLKENVRFLYVARGSLVETRFWMKRALTRKLIDQESYQGLLRQLDHLLPQLNAFINGKRKQDHQRTAKQLSAKNTPLPSHLTT
jgi:four helix bundle protein